MERVSLMTNQIFVPVNLEQLDELEVLHREVCSVLQGRTGSYAMRYTLVVNRGGLSVTESVEIGRVYSFPTEWIQDTIQRCYLQGEGCERLCRIVCYRPGTNTYLRLGTIEKVKEAVQRYTAIVPEIRQRRRYIEVPSRERRSLSEERGDNVLQPPSERRQQASGQEKKRARPNSPEDLKKTDGCCCC